jgi:hypothetical protein
VLAGLKITGPTTVIEKADLYEESSEESSEEESLEADWDKLLDESETMAKPHISKPPIEKPRRTRASALLCVQPELSLDERAPDIEDLEAAVLGLPIVSPEKSSSTTLAQLMDISCLLV